MGGSLVSNALNHPGVCGLNNGSGAYLHNAVLPIVLERLESRLLEELQLSISGDDADEETAARARRLNSLAASVIADVSGRKKESWTRLLFPDAD